MATEAGVFYKLTDQPGSRDEATSKYVVDTSLQIEWPSSRCFQWTITSQSLQFIDIHQICIDFGLMSLRNLMRRSLRPTVF